MRNVNDTRNLLIRLLQLNDDLGAPTVYTMGIGFRAYGRSIPCTVNLGNELFGSVGVSDSAPY